jgi:hypothetical protein
MTPIREAAGLRIAELPSDGPPIGAEADASDLVGQFYGEAVDLIVIPLERLVPDFFRLSNGLAGAFIQKIVLYRYRVAFLGDITVLTATSKPLNDFVYESNRGSAVWFVRDQAELDARL